MTCTNCSTITIGPYCHHCGQKTEHARYTIKALGRELFYSLIDLEKGLPHTILILTTKPGNAIRKVISGHRSSLYSPFKYVVLIGAIVVLFSLRYNFFNNEYTQAGAGKMGVPAIWTFIPNDYHTFVTAFFRFAEDKATILNIIAIPVFALLSFLLLSGHKYNFAENLVLNTYITAQQLFFLLLFIPAYEFAPEHKTVIISLYTGTVMIYNIWVYVQFFGRTASNVAKATAAVIIGYLCQFPVNFFLFFCYEKYLGVPLKWMHLV